MPSGSPGSRVSRETRLLLLTVLLSVVALLVLARIRFPERPASPALVPPLLTQLRTPTPFEDLANAVSTLEAEVTPSLQLLTIAQPAAGASRVVPALRIGPYAAVALVDPTSPGAVEGDVIARDRVTGLAVVRTQPARAPERRLWTPQRVESPRYLLVTEASPTGASLRPVFVGALRSTESDAWNTSVWIVPRHLDLPRGGFAFTTTGALAGLIVDERDSQALVPADAVMAAAERLLTTEQAPPGTLGIQVQELTKPIADALGIATGVVVVHVEPGGPADGILPTDVIEAINDRPVANAHQWQARVARLAAGEQATLRIRRGTAVETVTLKAADAVAARPHARLGLTLRTVPGVGAEITLVQPGSIAAVANLRAGDIVTRAGTHAAPTALQITRAFESLAPGGAMLVAVSRGTERFVAALTKP
jgi:S1-C subfamily serine protease